MKNKIKKYKRIMIITLVISVMFIIPTSALTIDDYEYELYSYKHNQDVSNISYNIYKTKDLAISTDYNNQYFLFINSLFEYTNMDLFEMANQTSITALWTNVGAYVGQGYFLWHTYDIDNNQWQSDNDYYQNNGQLITDYQQFSQQLGNVIKSSSINNSPTKLGLSINQTLYNIIVTDVQGCLYKYAENNYISWDKANELFNKFLESNITYNYDYINDENQSVITFNCYKSLVNQIPMFSSIYIDDVSINNDYDLYMSLKYIFDVTTWSFLPNTFARQIVAFVSSMLLTLISFSVVKKIILLFAGGV